MSWELVSIGSIDFRNRDPVAVQEPGETRTIGTGAFDTDQVDIAEAL